MRERTVLMYFVESPSMNSVINDFWLTEAEAKRAMLEAFPREEDRELLSIRLRPLTVIE